MIIEEINKLLSIELDLHKDKISYENEYLTRLKKLELTKEKLLANNKEGAKNALEKIKLEELKTAQKKVNTENKEFDKEIEQLNNSFKKNKKKLVSEFFSELIKDAEKF
ncbi:hypothetical protein JXB41_03980 [Candidatus Woesearchaeota archaeon]|nr:hypothetical protein [Candidatus Woesearchaeota archaeon]